MKVALNMIRTKVIGGMWTKDLLCTVGAVYDGTPPNSPARRLMVDVWTTMSTGEMFKSIKKLPNDCVKNLSHSMDKLRPNKLGNLANKNGIAAYLETPTKTPSAGSA